MAWTGFTGVEMRPSCGTGILLEPRCELPVTGPARRIDHWQRQRRVFFELVDRFVNADCLGACAGHVEDKGRVCEELQPLIRDLGSDGAKQAESRASGGHRLLVAAFLAEQERE